MLDVLLYLFEHYVEEGREVPHDEAILKTVLKDAGFPQSEINKAFVWLEDLTQQRGEEHEAQTPHSSFRIYSRQEHSKLNIECRGYLMSLECAGIIGAQTRELIIERAMALEPDELDLDRFKLIIMMVLANQTGEEHLQDWIEALIFDNASGRLH
ncbi:MAG: DUF494 domain-containing protein [Chromatiales bacterium]|jgi:Smg protein|nr:DUF494 domain-containing protein [Chromatiales bacterium]